MRQGYEIGIWARVRVNVALLKVRVTVRVGIVIIRVGGAL
jgi:hypothetical protein